MLFMTPNLRMYLNAVMSFLILGKLMYLHLSSIGTSSSRSNFLVDARSGSNKSSPTSSLVASMTIVELVALGVFSTCSLIRVICVPTRQGNIQVYSSIFEVLLKNIQRIYPVRPVHAQRNWQDCPPTGLPSMTTLSPMRVCFCYLNSWSSPAFTGCL
jgi:hypothetical protein